MHHETEIPNSMRTPTTLIKISLSLLCGIAVLPFITSCQESLEKRAAREAKEYTQKSCPTPERDYTIIDSLGFDLSTHTFIYYYTLTGTADNASGIEGHEGELHDVLIRAVRNNTSMKRYKEEGYSFRYVYRSQKNKNQKLYDTTITAEEYR